MEIDLSALDAVMGAPGHEDPGPLLGSPLSLPVALIDEDPDQPRTEFDATLQKQLHHHRPAMALQFEHVLAGKRMRRGEIQLDALIDRLPVGSLERGQCCKSRLRLLAAQALGEFGERRARHTHNANAAPARRCRNGGYSVAR